MKILCLDTSSDLCSVALLEDLNQIKEINIKDGKTHSENLMPLIQKILQETNIKLSDIDLIACDKGPGSFTGIRIGISSVKAMAEVMQIPVMGICSLDSLTYHMNIQSGIICSMIDARNNQVYCGIYDKNHNKIEEYIADDINVIIEKLKKYSDTINFVGNASILHKELLQKELNEVQFTQNNDLNAVNVGKCAFEKLKTQGTENADTISPLYLRKSQAERMKDLGEKYSN